MKAVKLARTETPKGTAQVFNRLISGTSLTKEGLVKIDRALDRANE